MPKQFMICVCRICNDVISKKEVTDEELDAIADGGGFRINREYVRATVYREEVTLDWILTFPSWCNIKPGCIDAKANRRLTKEEFDELWDAVKRRIAQQNLEEDLKYFGVKGVTK